MIRLLRINKMVQVNLKHEKISEANINPRINVWSTMGDAVAQWLVLWTYSHEVWVWDLAVSLCCVCRKNTALSQHLFWLRSIDGWWQTVKGSLIKYWGVGAVTLWLDWHPIWGRGIVIFLLASCYGYPHKLWQDGPLSLGYRVQTYC